MMAVRVLSAHDHQPSSESVKWCLLIYFVEASSLSILETAFAAGEISIDQFESESFKNDGVHDLAPSQRSRETLRPWLFLIQFFGAGY